MINSFQLLRNVGQFENVNAGNLLLQHWTFVYAENGRGKTTISGILRSLSNGDADALTERRRLGTQHPPHVVVQCVGGPPAAMFQNGAWNRTVPEVAVFDDRFVDENVYSGLVVGSEHRQKMHELILGAQGIALNNRFQALVRQIEAHNTEIRNRQAAIPAAIMGGLSVNDFCDLPVRTDIDAAIVEAERAVAAAQEQAPVRQTPAFDTLGLPAFDLQGLDTLLARHLPDLDAAAAERVQHHLQGLGHGAEAWIAQGMPYAANAQEHCPFCAQPLAGSAVFQHYRAYFAEAYGLLKDVVADTTANNERVHGGTAQVNFERAVRIATERRTFWARFCAVPAIDLDTAAIAHDWQRARELIAQALAAKAAAPLDRMAASADLRNAIAAYEMQRQRVADVSAELVAVNQAIALVKQAAAAANLATLEGDLRRLRATKARHDPQTAPLCEAYLQAVLDKTATEALRDQARAALDTYRQNAFPGYQAAINRYLARFNAGYRLDNVQAVNNRGGASCTYNVLINNNPVAVDGAAVVRGRPSFRTALSAGDRNTLALAFFFASLELDPGRAQKIVVIDDPVSSLDEHRSLTTVQEMRNLGRQVQQLIVLSHSKPFLCRLWEAADPATRCALQVSRVAAGSALQAWTVENDAITEHDRRHALLRVYAAQGPGPGRDLRAVAVELRPALEAFCRVAFPEYFPPGTLLGPFRGLCQQRQQAGTPIMPAADVQELADLIDYGNLFHHDTNAAWQTVVINDHELTGFTNRVLVFCTRG